MFTVILYVLSIAAFCIAAWILPLFLMPIVLLTKPKGEVIAPTDIRFIMPFVVSTVILLNMTGVVWGKFGYNVGWLFPLIILVLHFAMGNSRVANLANQAQAFGVVLGVVAYSALSFLQG